MGRLELGLANSLHKLKMKDDSSGSFVLRTRFGGWWGTRIRDLACSFHQDFDPLFVIYPISITPICYSALLWDVMHYWGTNIDKCRR